VDTEINLQLGEYTLKNHALQALPAHINRHPDFMQIFGAKRESNPIQCVEVQNSSHRMWVRLIGLRHDIQLWDVEPRQPSRQPQPRRYTDTFDERELPKSAKEAQGEAWIAAVLEPYRRQYLRSCELYLPAWDHSGQGFACLSGVMEGGTAPAPQMETPRPPGTPGGNGMPPAAPPGGINVNSGGVNIGEASGAGPAAPAPPSQPMLKEVVVFRDPPVVHVYDVVSHGRRFYRTLVASSDNIFCLHDMPCTLFLQGETPKFVAGDPRKMVPPKPSLVITRNLTKNLGTQMFIPNRLLHGLLPAALLEAYVFWQNDDDSLTGYPRIHAPMGVKATRLQLKLTPIGEPGGDAQAVITCSREPIKLDEPSGAAAADAAAAGSDGDGGNGSARPETIHSKAVGTGGVSADAAAAAANERHVWEMALA
jgi:hypothetical protein